MILLIPTIQRITSIWAWKQNMPMFWYSRMNIPFITTYFSLQTLSLVFTSPELLPTHEYLLYNRILLPLLHRLRTCNHPKLFLFLHNPLTTYFWFSSMGSKGQQQNNKNINFFPNFQGPPHPHLNFGLYFLLYYQFEILIWRFLLTTQPPLISQILWQNQPPPNFHNFLY